MKRIKIIGCGNILAFDEGVGIHIVRRLRREILPEWITIEVKTGHMSLQLIAGSDTGSLLTLISGIGPEGFIRRHFHDADLKHLFPTIHAIYLSSMFEIKEDAFSRKLQEIIVFGIRIGERNKFIGLSHGAFASLENVIKAILHELY